MAESNYNPPAHCWFALFVIWLTLRTVGTSRPSVPAALTGRNPRRNLLFCEQLPSRAGASVAERTPSMAGCVNTSHRLRSSF